LLKRLLFPVFQQALTTVLQVSTRLAETMHIKVLLLLVLGHLITDTPQGALPALLPLLKEVHGLNYAEAGALVMTMNLTSSVIQPLFGYFTDRWNVRWLAPAGVAMSGLGFAFIGLAPGYLFILVSVVGCGLGIASFHPESYKAVLNSSAERKVVGVSWFMVGGNLGMALGPILVTAYCAWLGLSGVMLFAIPGLFTGGLILAYSRRMAKRADPDSAPTYAEPPVPQPLGDRVKPLGILVGAVVLRSCIHTGVATFVPFYYVSVLGGDPLIVGTLLTTFLAAGVVGTILGAPLAEKIGPKRFFVISVAACAPLLLLMLQVQGFLLFVIIAVLGAFLLSTWSTIMVMGQQIMPDRAGMVSGLLVGFALGTGGVGAAVMGIIADHYGVTMVLYIITVLPILSALVGCFVPSSHAADAARVKA
jgi:FSR family fosmidomycin resistance protein-like MFS transporter